MATLSLPINEPVLWVAAVVVLALGFVVGSRNRRSAEKRADPDVAKLEARLDDVLDRLRHLDTSNAGRLGELGEQLRELGRVHGELGRTTAELRQAFASPQTRGQWGERMADDVLRAAGFVEGINYRTQVTTSSGTRPDVTFLLPQDRVVHMDVKFPIAGYLELARAQTEHERQRLLEVFLRAVRARVGELDGRGYIDPADGTLDCVLLFVPNDQIHAFVMEHDPQLLDDALARGVVLCSPTTLFAVLAVIRQAAEQFALERTGDEILELLAAFAAQWDRFTDVMERVGRGLETTQRAYDALSTTRRTQLERQLARIDELRQQRSGDAADGRTAHGRSDIDGRTHNRGGDSDYDHEESSGRQAHVDPDS